MVMVLGLPRIATGPDPSDDRHHEQLMIVTLVDHETSDARYHEESHDSDVRCPS